MQEQQKQLFIFEEMLHRLEEELHTANIANTKRDEFKKRIAECKRKFQNVTSGKNRTNFKDIEFEFNEIDKELAFEALRYAETVISKREKREAAFLALEKLRSDLEEGTFSPSKIRHEIKDVMRHTRIVA